MKEREIVLADLPQENDFKPRPAIVLKVMVPYDDYLVCGLSTQLHREVVSFDDRIQPGDADFVLSRLKEARLFVLAFFRLFHPAMCEAKSAKFRQNVTNACFAV